LINPHVIRTSFSYPPETELIFTRVIEWKYRGVERMEKVEKLESPRDTHTTFPVKWGERGGEGEENGRA
jgi:hypothetical protein